MSKVDRLLGNFIRGFTQRGEADPRLYLDQLEGDDRRELAALIDGYLDRAPGRSWDPAAFASSTRAGAIADRLVSKHLGPEPTEGEPGVSLRDLRARAGRSRAELASRLADLLGLGGGERRIAYHYHRLESGLLDADGVSVGAIDALAGVLGASGTEIRAALSGGAGAVGTRGQASPALARSSITDADAEIASSAPLPASPGTGENAEPAVSDERVDEVFLSDS